MKYESQYYGVVQMEDIVEHHGVKGMKWGIRNGPPYPIGAKTRKAMAKASRVKYGDGKYGDTKRHIIARSLKDGATAAAVTAGLSVYALRPLVFRTPVYTLPGIAAGSLAVGTAVTVSEAIGAIKADKKELASEQRISQLPIDKKTGLHKKDREWTRKEDVAAINPGYKNFNDDTKNNCMLCTTTYDIRRRGYDTVALKNSTGFSAAKVKEWYPKADIYVSRTPTKAALTKALMDQGDGARGNLMVTWSGTLGGHSMAYEVHDGKVHIYDGQLGKERSMSDFMDRVGMVSYARLDNVEPDWKKIKECCK